MEPNERGWHLVDRCPVLFRPPVPSYFGTWFRIFDREPPRGKSKWRLYRTPRVSPGGRSPKVDDDKRARRLHRLYCNHCYHCYRVIRGVNMCRTRQIHSPRWGSADNIYGRSSGLFGSRSSLWRDSLLQVGYLHLFAREPNLFHPRLLRPRTEIFVGRRMFSHDYDSGHLLVSV